MKWEVKVISSASRAYLHIFMIMNESLMSKICLLPGELAFGVAGIAPLPAVRGHGFAAGAASRMGLARWRAGFGVSCGGGWRGGWRAEKAASSCPVNGCFTGRKLVPMKHGIQGMFFKAPNWIRGIVLKIYWL